jgi:response regulator RpfG family c-di-GMP phosphodiesterase
MGDRELKRKALDLGATDLLTKPVHLEDLSSRLNSVFRLKAYQDELKALNADLEQRVEYRTQDLKWARLDIIWRLAKAGEFRDEETGEHIVRVGCYCRILAEQIGMSRDFVESIFLTSPLHDIGKIGIPDSILLKPGRLTPQEREVMQCHCKIGANILLEEANGMKPFLEWQNVQVPSGHACFENMFMTMASSIAMHHHERWDGTGYPDSLAGEDIPLAARITGIVDVYDALRSDRPYKQAYSHADAMKIMRSEASASCFDPIVYEAFEATQDEFQRIRAENEELVTARRNEIQPELVGSPMKQIEMNY